MNTIQNNYKTTKPYVRIENAVLFSKSVYVLTYYLMCKYLYNIISIKVHLVILKHNIQLQVDLKLTQYSELH